MIKAQIPIGNIVEDFKVGNTHIMICDDDCRDKTPEDKARAIKRMEVIAANAIAAGKYKPRNNQEISGGNL
jgi:hypothetical protein